MKNKKIGIVGSRRRNTRRDFLQVRKKFLQLHKEGDVIVSGGCSKGADSFAEKMAKDFGISIIIHYPNWSKYGKVAGFKRNSFIADDSDILIACVAEDRKGGTEDTIKKFLRTKTEDKLFII